MKRILTLVLTLAILACLHGAALAVTVVGTPTLGETDTVVGLVDGPQIMYYIPLSGDPGVYGDSGYGMSSDTVSLSGSGIDGPLMEMFIHFVVPDGEMATSATFMFYDLDLTPYNDPTGFYETLHFFNDASTGIPTGSYSDWGVLNAEPNVTVNNMDPSSNNLIVLDIGGLSIASGDFWIHLGFESSSDFRWGTWTNTREKLFAATMTTTTVPEPATLILLGSGLAGLAMARRRK